MSVGLAFRDLGADPEDAGAAVERAGDAGDHVRQLPHPVQAGGDRAAAGGLLRQRLTAISPHWVSSRVRGMGVAVITSMSARRAASASRRRRRLPLAGQHEALRHAEAVLLVHHGEAEVAEADAFLEQGVGADRDVDRAFRQAGQHSPPLRALHAAGQQTPPDAGGWQSATRVRRCWRRAPRWAPSARLGAGSTARSMARRPTRVLPEPTSPLRGGGIRLGAARSASISAERLFLAAGEGVAEGGQRRLRRRSSPTRLRPGRSRARRRTRARAICLARTSS
jgi:hypothetical protein